MTMQQQEQKKKKLKKSVAELWEEFISAKKRIAVVYVPLICEAMKDENPDMDYMDIKDKVVSQAVEQGWNEPYIVRCLPSWIVAADPKRDMHHLRALKIAEAKRENKDLELKVLKLAHEPLVEPPAPKERKETFTELDDEELDKELHSMQLDKFGDTGESIRELYGDITHHANGLFKVMTQKEMPYADNEDIILEYIKPSREYWKSLMLEFDKTKRTRTHNELSYIAELIEDRLEILKEIGK